MTAPRQVDLPLSSEVLEPVEGNYFVSAYPPFLHWKKEETGAVRHLLATAARSTCDVRFGLYVHIPFCAHRCQYCYYRSYAGKSRDEMDRYLDAVLDELAIYGVTPALAGRKLDFVYFGGGTPSLLSAEQIDRLMRSIQEIFPWTDESEVTFECAPKTTTERKLAVLHATGVTRISLGVQQLDDAVLKKNDRIHLVHDVERAYSAIQHVGFQTVNLDLMVGLVDETEQSFRKSLERVVEMQPDSVTIYQMEIPKNTPLYHALCDGDLESEPATWDVKRARLAHAFARLEQAGYTVRSAYAATRGPEKDRFLYPYDQYHGADLLGIGVASFSYLSGVHYQNFASLDEYLASLATDQLPLYRAYPLDGDERLVREFVLQLKLGTIEAQYFRDKFDVEICERFAEPLGRLAHQGWLTVDRHGVSLTREGLLRVDRFIPEFYLSQHSNERYE